MQPETEASKEPDSLTTIQKLESLSKVDIFSRLGPHELLLLANSSAVQDYPTGEVIYREGETAHHIYNLINGRVELRREPDQIEEIRPGGSFGALAVLSGQPRFFTAQVTEPARCIKVEREAFWEMVEDYPSAARAIFEVLSGQILTMMGRLSNQKGEE
jgi:trk system potassium uptake protein TrkA